MAVTEMMALISGGLSTIIDGRSRSHYRVNRERNGLHAPNTSNQNREGATGTSSQDHSDAIPINFRDETNINYRDHSHNYAKEAIFSRYKF